MLSLKVWCQPNRKEILRGVESERTENGRKPTLKWKLIFAEFSSARTYEKGMAASRAVKALIAFGDGMLIFDVLCSRKSEKRKMG